MTDASVKTYPPAVYFGDLNTIPGKKEKKNLIGNRENGAGIR